MGYQVESYSLNELHRISVPGSVPPSLFWALPVGRWEHPELERVWRWFTEKPSQCNDFRLLLVKSMGRRERRDANVDLASVGAKLSELMPAGSERFMRPGNWDRGESTGILVLSGGYPQPGWGVLVEWQQKDIHRLENLIHCTIGVLQDWNDPEGLQGFKEATQAFHQCQKLRRPEAPDVSIIENDILAAEKIERFLREALEALQAGQYKLVGERIIAAMRRVGLECPRKLIHFL